jgi:methyl-accepting chemotaxis protein
MGVSIGSENTQRKIAEAGTIIEDIRKIVNGAVATSKEAADSVEGKNPLLNEIVSIWEECSVEIKKMEDSIGNVERAFREIERVSNEGSVDSANELGRLH